MFCQILSPEHSSFPHGCRHVRQEPPQSRGGGCFVPNTLGECRRNQRVGWGEAVWLVSESWGHPSCVLAHPCQACEGSRALRPVLSPESLLQARGLRRLLRVWGAEGVQRGGGGQCPRGCWDNTQRQASLTATASCCLCQCEWTPPPHPSSLHSCSGALLRWDGALSGSRVRVCMCTCSCVYTHDLAVYQVCARCGAPTTSLGRVGSSVAGRLAPRLCALQFLAGP